MHLQKLGARLQYLRHKKRMLIREVAEQLDVDPAIISKIENCKRRPTKYQVEQFASLYQINKRELLVAFYSDEVCQVLEKEEFAFEAIIQASKKIKQYQKVK
jgi:HTH-type transcriptional regulator, competence development regulator